LENKWGVPQGSVLGPILYLLYVNDIKNAVRKCNIKLFADDTVLYYVGSSVEDVEETVQTDLDHLSEWLEFKKLKVNVQKTNFMLFTNKSMVNVRLFMDGQSVERVSSLKYLGVVIDEKLKFQHHLNFVSKKAGKKFGVLCRLNKDLTFWSKILVYKSIIAPHFEYCTSILFLFSDTQMYQLQKIQNRCMRLVLRCGRRVPVRAMLATLGWLSVKQRVYYKTLQLIKKIKLGLVPAYLLEEIVLNGDVHSYPTRAQGDFRLKRCVNTATMNSLFYKGLQIFNSMPSSAKICDDVRVFNKLCIQFVKEKYPL
jgi:hypothetical protein